MMVCGVTYMIIVSIVVVTVFFGIYHFVLTLITVSAWLFLPLYSFVPLFFMYDALANWIDE